MRVLVSACLLGTPCRYDGKSKPHPLIEELISKHDVIPVCGEVMGGLPTPRIPAERMGNAKVMNQAGIDVTENYRRGAEEVLRLGRLFNCNTAILKEKSPSCGNGKIYDGTFSRTLVDGYGVTAELLRNNGFTVLGESDLEEFLKNN